MSADKRSVHTDALQTLGTIITEGGRDAIHLAVEPVIAGETLRPGEHIGLIDGKAYSESELMDAAEQWIETGEYTYENSERYKDHYDKMDEFWERYEKVTGKTVSNRGNFFTCSC